MKELTARGTTVEEAIQSALKQLRITKERADITVIDQGSKGFLKIFGAKPAIVKVTVKPDSVQEARQYLERIARQLLPEAVVEIEKQRSKQVTFQIRGANPGILIGKRGQTLYALEQLTEQVINRKRGNHYTVIVDAEGYRKRRKEALILLAERSAAKAVQLHKPVILDPMPASERKTIHAALSRNKRVETLSEGKDPYRAVVIKPVMKASV